MGGRKVKVKRPRVRDDDGEITLDTYRQFCGSDPLEERALEQMVVGVSTRKYERSLEALPVSSLASNTSKSSVSRRFIAATQKQLSSRLKQPLHELDIKVVMLDGIHFGEHLVVIAVGIDGSGRKHVLGFWEGSTENAAVCNSLLSSLVERGLSAQQSLLFVIDGGKGLRKSIREMFGGRAIVQRCQLHKMRNVIGHLPKQLHRSTRQSMREAYAGTNKETAKKRLRLLANSFTESHPGAKASLMEGLDETLSVMNMRLGKDLTRSLSSTNIIENLNGNIRRMTRRVKQWKGGAMVLRWVASAVTDAEAKFRRLRGHKHMLKLVAFLQQHDTELDRGLDDEVNAA